MNEDEKRATEFHVMSDFRHYAQSVNQVLYMDLDTGRPVRVADLVDQFMNERYS